MIVDTSALMAIILEEPERDAMLLKLADDPVRRISAGTWMELATVIIRQHPGKADTAEALVQRLGLIVENVTLERMLLGRDAYRAYGKGTMSPARLNFGDCFAYALSKATGEPLLFKGDDFSQTDIVAA